MEGVRVNKDVEGVEGEEKIKEKKTKGGGCQKVN